MGRRIRSRLDQLQPSIAQTVRRTQERQKELHDMHSRQRSLLIGDKVLVRELGGSKRSWTSGVIVECRGPLTFDVRLDDGRTVRRHMDHIRVTSSNTLIGTPDTSNDEAWDAPAIVVTDVSNGAVECPPQPPEIPGPRRSARRRRPPDRYI